MLMHLSVAWRSGLRSYGFWLVLALGGVLMFASFLAGAFSLRQPLIVSLDVGISGIRFLTILLGLYWLQEVVAKDVDKRTIFFALAYPHDRASYLFGRYLGVVTMLAASILVLGALLWVLNGFSSWGYEDSSRPVLDARYMLVLLGIWLDACVVTAFSLWVITLAETPFLAVALGFFFALSGRSLGGVVEYLLRPQAADPHTVATFLPMMQKVQWFIPDLSRLDWRSGILYGQWPNTEWVVWASIMALAYTALMLSAAWWKFEKREFN